MICITHICYCKYKLVLVNQEWNPVLMTEFTRLHFTSFSHSQSHSWAWMGTLGSLFQEIIVFLSPSTQVAGHLAVFISTSPHLTLIRIVLVLLFPIPGRISDLLDILNTKKQERSRLEKEVWGVLWTRYPDRDESVTSTDPSAGRTLYCCAHDSSSQHLLPVISLHARHLKMDFPLTHHTVGLVSLILKRQRNYGIYEFKWLPKSHSYWVKGWLESRSFEPKGMLFSGDPTPHLWSVDAFLPGTVPFPHAIDKPIKGKWEGQRKNAEFSTGLWLGLGTNSWHFSALCLDTERTDLCLFCCFIKALPPPSLADVWGMVPGVPVEDKAAAQASHKGV